MSKGKVYTIGELEAMRDIWDEYIKKAFNESEKEDYWLDEELWEEKNAVSSN